MCKTSKNSPIFIVGYKIWSKQLSSGKAEPMAQEKMGEMMSHMSQVLKEMAGAGGGDMYMDHHKKIEAREKEWDPFDTSDKM